MALSNAEKQQRWREKHLGEDGGKAMLQVAVRKTTIDMLHRMARSEEVTIAGIVETLIRDKYDKFKVAVKKEREKAEAKKEKAAKPKKVKKVKEPEEPKEPKPRKPRVKKAPTSADPLVDHGIEAPPQAAE